MLHNEPELPLSQMVNTSFAANPILEIGKMEQEFVLILVKQAIAPFGYYGYPHSDRFVCIRGEVNDSSIKGEALEILWDVNPESNISKSNIEWDSEGRLTLGKGNIVRTEEGMDGTIHWILFPKASLNVKGFYRYTAPRMTPPSQLCLWR
ncbi:hypothetical protein [Scytonema sp. NUACC26]|uniref:hypothetical protein n=1 Tax=Scytonema sp. NUACC26 TaxID=3140176 RepID=UPI0034DC8858